MIETDRLLLRRPVADDLSALYTLTEPPAVRQFLGIASPSRADSFARLMRNIGSWSAYGYGTFTVIDRASGGFAGNCGVFHSFRGLGEDFDNQAEAGWIIDQRFWGRGYAREAMAAAYRWFDRECAIDRTVCMIEPANTASFPVARALGFSPLRTASLGAAPVVLMVRDRPGEQRSDKIIS